jgi:hypothetical protein
MPSSIFAASIPRPFIAEWNTITPPKPTLGDAGVGQL